MLAQRIAQRFGLHPTVLDHRVRLEIETGHRFVTDVVEAFPGEIEGVSVHKPSLEDVFIRRTGHRFWTETDGEGTTGIRARDTETRAMRNQPRILTDVLGLRFCILATRSVFIRENPWSRKAARTARQMVHRPVTRRSYHVISDPGFPQVSSRAPRLDTHPQIVLAADTVSPDSTRRQPNPEQAGPLPPETQSPA